MTQRADWWNDPQTAGFFRHSRTEMEDEMQKVGLPVMPVSQMRDLYYADVPWERKGTALGLAALMGPSGTGQDLMPYMQGQQSGSDLLKQGYMLGFDPLGIF